MHQKPGPGRSGAGAAVGVDVATGFAAGATRAGFGGGGAIDAAGGGAGAATLDAFDDGTASVSSSDGTAIVGPGAVTTGDGSGGRTAVVTGTTDAGALGAELARHTSAVAAIAIDATVAPTTAIAAPRFGRLCAPVPPTVRDCPDSLRSGGASGGHTNAASGSGTERIVASAGSTSGGGTDGMRAGAPVCAIGSVPCCGIRGVSIARLCVGACRSSGAA